MDAAEAAPGPEAQGEAHASAAPEFKLEEAAVETPGAEEGVEGDPQPDQEAQEEEQEQKTERYKYLNVLLKNKTFHIATLTMHN